MLRNLSKLSRNTFCLLIQKNTFLTNSYKCTDVWNSQVQSSSILNKINHSDFYHLVVQNFTSKGVISAIDVDIFVNSIKDSTYLEEVKDLLHKLRLSAETGNTLPSTHHAVIRSYIEYGDVQDLIQMLNDPLNFGLFLDDFTANILLDKLITAQNYEQAAKVASFVMLQEEYSNEITNTLCQFACYKFVMERDKTAKVVEDSPSSPAPKQKIEEIKIRVKFLRNPYFDDHFDIKDIDLLAGKTLAWISEKKSDNLNYNLQIIGWLIYKKYEKLLELCENLKKVESFKIFNEVLALLQQELEKNEIDKDILTRIISVTHTYKPMENPIESSLKVSIENAINKTQPVDISLQKQLFKSWDLIREEKLNEQIKRLDRAKRLELIEEKQKQMKSKEQKLWFFENEENIDLTIEEKEQLKDQSDQKSSTAKKDEDYIPPEIRPRRK